MQHYLVPLDGSEFSDTILPIASSLARATHADVTVCTVAPRPVSGQPGAVIAATADEEDADLIVMSTHARHGPLRTILDSVADDVVRRSHRPVLLVRRTPARAEASADEAVRTNATHG